MPEVSVIIVSWNACDYLRNCLNSIRKTGASAVKEVIVVDNDSKDGSAEMVLREFPEATLIRAGENLGFARANNLGIRHCTGSMLALVNSDVLVHPDCFQNLMTYLKSNPEAGLVGPQVLNGDGSIQRSCGRLPSLWTTACHFLGLDKIFRRIEFFSGFQMSNLTFDRPLPVEVLSGCFCVARSAAVEEVGGLDERFFFYAEDVDWCKRFNDAGWKVMLVPSARATHFGGGSSANAPLRYSIEILRANLLYWKKHHGISGQMGFHALALAQHSLRLVVRAFLRFTRIERNEFTKKKLIEHKVCIRWLLTGRGV
jgi:GT2 family glycosyltransferase